MSAALSRLGLLALLVLSAALGLGAACNRGGTRPGNPRITQEGTPPAQNANAPTFRLFYLVDLDGYLEPCGCQSRPLGGIDRLARFMAQSAGTPSLFVEVGDLMYRDPTLDPRMVFQETSKAETVVRILDGLHLTAVAPGASDFVRGAESFREKVGHGQASVLGANVSNAPGFAPFVLRDAGGVRVALVGVTDFRDSADATPPPGAPPAGDPVESARTAVAQARAQGARVVIVLASVLPRVARTIAGEVPGVDFVIVSHSENANPAAERIGNAYLLTAANQGKAVGVLDVFVRGDGTTGFVDASASTARAERARLDGQISRYEQRIAAAEQDPHPDTAALEQLRGRVAQLRRDRDALARGGPVPAQGSFFRSETQEISPDQPRSTDVQHTIAEYFHLVNTHNHDEYATLAPPAPQPGQRHYVGMEECRDCHADAFPIWERTPHSRAWNTLVVISKNFNLSCVGCHVTGYRQPGGAEVVQNEGRQDVQCEACHGPGSDHIAAHTDAQRRATIVRNPQGDFCAGQCHTPEHSDHFDYATYRPRILGPGHGYPVGSTEGGVKLTDPVLLGTATPPHDALSTSDGGGPTPPGSGDH